jgi:hypothetical protein
MTVKCFDSLLTAGKERRNNMNASEVHSHPVQRILHETVAGSSMTEGIGAICTIVLAVLGLAGAFTNVVASIATIVVGAIFLADNMLARSTLRTLNAKGVHAGLGSGVSASFFAGIAGIVLGILSFFNPMPERLVSVAVLVFGAALFLGAGTYARLNWLLSHPEDAGSAATATVNGGVFAGLAVTVLGILAVVGLAPMTLALVGLLCLGTAALFSGTPSEMAQ